MQAQSINCLKCKYYYITWDTQKPYGCKFFGFKSYQTPSVVVLQSSGSPCQGFEDKSQNRQKNI